MKSRRSSWGHEPSALGISPQPPVRALYVGRFAPSPTGPLHFGSLLAALASYLDARANRGQWLLRMEDLDPPRHPAGAADSILRQLEGLGLHWDGPVLYQSSRLNAYAEVLQRLTAEGLCYLCDCSRARLRGLGRGRKRGEGGGETVYDGKCRGNALSVQEADKLIDGGSGPPTNSTAGEALGSKAPPQGGSDYASGEYAVRVRTEDGAVDFDDLVQGRVSRLLQDAGDFVVRRKDGLFAYQLAVVVDDGFQQVSHAIRGADLLHATPWQMYLQRRLGLPQPRYGHIPVIVDRQGQKLSKQRLAPAIDTHQTPALLRQALQALGQPLPENTRDTDSSSTRGSTETTADMPAAELLQWAVSHWDIQAVPRRSSI